MSKYIHPMAYQLSEATLKIADLEKRNHDLDKEVQRLRGLVNPDQRCPKDQQSQQDTKKQAKDSSEIPSYQRGTVSFRNRTARDQPQEKPQTKLITVNGTLGRYQDGRFIRIDEKPFLNAQKSTASSLNKIRGGVKLPPKDDRPIIRFRTNHISPKGNKNSPEVDGWGAELNGWNQSNNAGWGSDTTNVWGAEPENSRTVEPRVKVHTQPKPAPRIVDDLPLLKNDTDYIHIRSDKGYQLLSKALWLAKEIFHDAAKKHWPEIWKNQFPGGPQEVLFGNSELLDCFFSFCPPSLEVRYYGSEVVRRGIFGIIPLRNMVSHFGRGGSYLSLNEYDEFLRPVFLLAAFVDDVDRAAKAQKLRRQLREEGQRTLDEIEALEPLAMLPFTRPWSSHHEETFDHFSRWKSQAPAETHPAMMIRLVEREETVETNIIF
ncbi:hypothetical protein F4809DRAFT_663548 [Biscogniauxia mediterranea]|nr:hypothetical protein F4809DRAFT_663548 [Biscogniauxia mediterranea]